MLRRIQKMNSEWNNWVERSTDSFAAVGRTQSETELLRVVDDICIKMKISETNTFLDVGCGTGVLIRSLKDKVNSAKGVDFSEKMIEIARRENKSIEFFVARSDGLPFEDSNFDRILCYSVFHYFDGYSHAFRTIDELIRVCSAGGLILIGDIPSKEYFNKLYPFGYKVKRAILLILKDISNFLNSSKPSEKRWHEAYWIGRPSS